MNVREFTTAQIESCGDAFLGTQVQELLFQYIPDRFLETPYVEHNDESLQLESNKDGIFFWGGVGVGKTTRMFQVMISRAFQYKLKSEKQLWCGDVIKMVSDYKYAPYADKEAVLAKYCNVNELYVDDLGVEIADDVTGMFLYAITERRWGNKLPTFFTSNNKVGEWGSRYEGLGARIASRIVDMTKIIEVTGTDYRLLNRA